MNKSITGAPYNIKSYNDDDDEYDVLMVVCVCINTPGVTRSTCQTSPCRGSRPSLSILPTEQHSARRSTCRLLSHRRSSGTAGWSGSGPGPRSLPSDG